MKTRYTVMETGAVRMPACTWDVMKSVMWWLFTPVRWGFMPASQTLATFSLCSSKAKT